MNTLLKKHLIGLMSFVVSLAIVIPAHAQPSDAGWKIRGSKQPSYSGSRYSGPVVRDYVRLPSAEPATAHRSFSYAPAPYGVGDMVAIAVDEAKVMLGKDVLATVKKGEKFNVLKVEGPWLGAKVEIDGKSVSGWIWSADVTLVKEPAAAPSTPQATAPAESQSSTTIRRSFSVEPSTPNVPYRSPARTDRPDWAKQKMLRNS